MQEGSLGSALKLSSLPGGTEQLGRGGQCCRDENTSGPALFGHHGLFFSPFLYLQRGLLHHSCSGEQSVMTSTGLRASRDRAGNVESLPGRGEHQLVLSSSCSV